MSKASKKEKKKLRRMAELQRLQATQNQQPMISAPSASTGNASVAQVSVMPHYSSEITAEFAHVKTDLIRIAVYVLIIVSIIAALELLNIRFEILSKAAESIFRFLGLSS